MTEYMAIEIINPKIAEIATTLNPELKKHDFEYLHTKWLVFGFPGEGDFTLVNPVDFYTKGFDHILPGMIIRTNQFVTRDGGD